MRVDRIDLALKCGDMKIGDDGAADAALAFRRANDGNAARLEKHVERRYFRTHEVVTFILHSTCWSSHILAHQILPGGRLPPSDPYRKRIRTARRRWPGCLPNRSITIALRSCAVLEELRDIV